MPEISQYKLPISWRIGSTECKGLTLTQIADLSDGMYELTKLQFWCAKRENLKFVSDRLAVELKQDHLQKEYQAALERYKARGKRIGKSRADKNRNEYLQQQRNVEFGLFS